MTAPREARAATLAEARIELKVAIAEAYTGNASDDEQILAAYDRMDAALDALVTAARQEEREDREAILDRAWRLVADDAWAMSFQTLGQYRTAVMEFLADEARAARIRARGERT